MFQSHHILTDFSEKAQQKTLAIMFANSKTSIGNKGLVFVGFEKWQEERNVND